MNVIRTADSRVLCGASSRSSSHQSAGASTRPLWCKARRAYPCALRSTKRKADVLQVVSIEEDVKAYFDTVLEGSLEQQGRSHPCSLCGDTGSLGTISPRGCLRGSGRQEEKRRDNEAPGDEQQRRQSRISIYCGSYVQKSDRQETWVCLQYGTLPVERSQLNTNLGPTATCTVGQRVFRCACLFFSR